MEINNDDARTFLKDITDDINFPLISNSNNQLESKPYYIQFLQLIAYFNFEIKLNKELTKEPSQPPTNKYFNDNKKFRLIDKNWLQKWKQFIGYPEIKTEYEKKNLNKELNENDYNWIEPIIKNHITKTKNDLKCLDNKVILDENSSIKPLAAFEIVDNICFKLFNIGNRKTDFLLMEQNCEIEIKILKEKIILLLNENNYSLIYKDKENKIIELLISFKEECENKNNILKDIEEKDINNWINDLGINLSLKDKFPMEKEKFEIINKTFQRNEKESEQQKIQKVLEERKDNLREHYNTNIIFNPQIKEKINSSVILENTRAISMINKDGKIDINNNNKYNPDTKIAIHNRIIKPNNENNNQNDQNNNKWNNNTNKIEGNDIINNQLENYIHSEGLKSTNFNNNANQINNDSSNYKDNNNQYFINNNNINNNNQNIFNGLNNQSNQINDDFINQNNDFNMQNQQINNGVLVQNYNNSNNNIQGNYYNQNNQNNQYNNQNQYINNPNNNINTFQNCNNYNNQNFQNNFNCNNFNNNEQNMQNIQNNFCNNNNNQQPCNQNIFFNNECFNNMQNQTTGNNQFNNINNNQFNNNINNNQFNNINNNQNQNNNCFQNNCMNQNNLNNDNNNNNNNFGNNIKLKKK